MASFVKIRSTLSGTCGLALAMGVGRFFFTPVLPLMITTLHWGSGPASWVASGNYLGYFVGSLLCAHGVLKPYGKTYRVSLILSTMLLPAVALSTNVYWQVIIRTLAGVFSALIFICITHSIPRVIQEDTQVGQVYAGVGLGILLSGLLVLLFGNHLSWQGLWIGAGVVSAILAAFAWQWPVPQAAVPAAKAVVGPREQKRPMQLLLIGYFFQGAGYIIIGTYLVALADPLFGLTAAAATWLLVGLAAVPSPLLWSWISVSWGDHRALLFCYIAQIIGALTVLFSHSIGLLSIAALLFGATFMGITMLTLSIGSKWIKSASAKLTTWYSVGQIVGPILVGVVFSREMSHGFIGAAILLILGLILSLLAEKTARKS